MGAVSMKTGSSARTDRWWMRARGVRPWSFTACSLAMSMAADASQIWLDTGGGEPAALDQGAGAIGSSPSSAPRGPSSTVTPPNGTISSLEAALGAGPQGPLVALDGEGLHVLAGDVPLLGDHLGAAELADLLVAVAGLTQPVEPANGSREAELLGHASSPTRSGSWHMFCTPPATTRSWVPLITPWAAKCTACCDEPHWRSMVVPGTCSGSPATSQHGAGDVAGLGADGVDAAEHDVLDGARVDAGAVDQGLERVGPEVGGVHLRQAAAPAPDGRADGVDDVGLGHVSSFSLEDRPPGSGGHVPSRAVSG